MAKDARALREEAAEATSAGKYKRALAAYLELERMEPRDAQWAKRAGETYKRLGNNSSAIEAFERSAERYAQNGFLVQAIAVCKLVLQIDPQHADTLRRLSTMSDQVGAGPTRAGGLAENNTALHDNSNVAMLRRPQTEGDASSPYHRSSGVPTAYGGGESARFSRPVATTPPATATAPVTTATATPARGLAHTATSPTRIPRIDVGGAEADPQDALDEMDAIPAAVPVPNRGYSASDSEAIRARRSSGTIPAPTLPAPVVAPPVRPAPPQMLTTALPRFAGPAPGTQPAPPTRPPPPVVAPPVSAPVSVRPVIAQPASPAGAPSVVAPPVVARPNPTASGPPTAAPGRTMMMPVVTRPAAPPAQDRRHPTTPPPAFARTRSRPVTLSRGSALDSIELVKEVPHARRRESSVAGVHLIPIGDETDLPHEHPPALIPPEVRMTEEIPVVTGAAGEGGDEVDVEMDTGSPMALEVEAPDSDVYEPDVDESTELELDDLEEIPLAEPRAVGTVAQRALAATPLFAGLPVEALEALVAELTLERVAAGETLFHEGDPGDALYVIAEGELAVLGAGAPGGSSPGGTGPGVELARLGPGQFLGEVALMTDQPRSATVTAIVDSELLRIDRITLATVLGNHGDVLRAVLRFVRDRLVDRWIRTSAMFRPFDPDQRAELAARFSFLEIDASTKLIGAGQRPDGLYIVLAGQFIVVRAGATVATLGPGDLIGEVALLSGGAFRSDVIATGKSLALCLPAPAFREVIMTHPHVLEIIGEHAENSRRLQIL